jgi:hypothetical protein
MRVMGGGVNEHELTSEASDGSGDVISISSRAAPKATLSTWLIVEGLQTLWEGEQCVSHGGGGRCVVVVVVVAAGSLLYLLIDGFSSE